MDVLIAWETQVPLGGLRDQGKKKTVDFEIKLATYLQQGCKFSSIWMQV